MHRIRSGAREVRGGGDSAEEDKPSPESTEDVLWFTHKALFARSTSDTGIANRLEGPFDLGSVRMILSFAENLVVHGRHFACSFEPIRICWEALADVSAGGCEAASSKGELACP